MNQVRPTPVLVLALLHFVFGSLGLLSTACGVGSQILLASEVIPQPPAAPGQPPPLGYQDIDRALAEKAPAYRIVQGVGLLANLTTGGLLLACGYGLLKLRPWGRNLSLLYACLSILSTLLSLAYLLAYTMPISGGIYDEAIRQGQLVGAGQLNQQQREATLNLMRVSGYLGVAVPLLTLAYPVVVFVVLTRPRIAAAFRNSSATHDG